MMWCFFLIWDNSQGILICQIVLSLLFCKYTQILTNMRYFLTNQCHCQVCDAMVLFLVQFHILQFSYDILYFLKFIWWYDTLSLFVYLYVHSLFQCWKCTQILTNTEVLVRGDHFRYHHAKHIWCILIYMLQK